MKERTALLLLGAWIMGSLVLLVVAPTNFRLIDALLEHSDNPSFRGHLERVGHDVTRELLRYLSSELNRKFFMLWNIAQLLIAAALMWLSGALPGGRRVRTVLLVAAALVAVLLFIQPMITSVGRSLDFVPRDPAPPQLARFQLLHVVYTAVEVIKLALVTLVAVWTVRQAPPSASPG